jgi:thiamine-monophosphate kinase
LALLESGRGAGAPELTAVYRVPEVPYGAGALLADAGAHAMIDVSDGLLADLEHICTASGVAMEIDPSRLEISELVAAAGELGIDPLVWALSGGEDHALIATLPEGAVLPEAAMVIGRVREGAGVTVRGIDTSSWKKGWNHFAGDAGEQTRA